MKDSREHIYDKIKFFKLYCHHLLSNGVDIYSNYYLVNLRNLMFELKSELVNHEYHKQRRLGGLTFFLKEIKSYLDTNYFYRKKVSKEIMQLTSSFAEFEQSNNEREYLSTKTNLSVIVELMIEKVSTSHILNDIICEIGHVIYNCEKLDDCYNKIKSLASDYICEILLRGLDYEKIKEELTKSTFSYESGGIIDKIEELFREFIWLPIDNEGKSYTFVFKIIGLKIYVKSIRIDDVLFYNPIREDLLRWREKEEIFSDEVYIMNPEDQELLKGYRAEMRKSDQDHYEIEYTDCHARLKINASGISQGLLRAKNKLDNVLQILKFNYSISNVRISDLYLVYDHSNGNQYIDSVTTEGKRRKSKLTEVDYYPRGLTDRILNDITNRNSQLNNILLVNNSEYKENLLKVIHWYNRGQDESDNHVKFVNYWVALEYLVGQNSSNIKTKMLNDLACVLSQVTFRNELRGLYSYFRNRFFGIGSVMKFPTELANISGFNEFHSKVDPSLFIENLLAFKNYTDDVFIKYRIDFLNKLNSDIKHQKTIIKQLEEKYKSLASRLYRIRNGLVHSALTGKNDISIYVEWLRYCVVLILNAAVSIDEDKNEVWNYEYAIKIFKEWKQKANKGQFIEFF